MRNFINTRLNKDNFWNLMFALILFTGSSSGVLIGEILGGVIFLISFISAILLVKNNSPIDFDKEKLVFITSRGKQIRTAGLLFIWLLISSKVIAMGLVALLLGPGKLFWEIFFPMSFFLPAPLLFFDEDILLNKLLFVFSFSIFPSLYCILRNFPMSIYFKKEAWVGDGVESHNLQKSSSNFFSNHFDDSKRTSMSCAHLHNNRYHSNFSSNAFDYTQRTSVQYANLPNNIYYSSYLDRYYRR